MADNEKWPKISIVIPSYNQGQYLNIAIRSIIKQNYPDIEIIIIDGKSTDNTIEIIKRYEEHLYYWISEDDDGQSDAINKGFKKCSGEIITFFSSDDIYFKGTFYHVAKNYMKNSSFGAFIGGFVFIDEYNNLNGWPRFPVLKTKSPVDLSLGPPGIYRLHQVSTFYSRYALDCVGRWVKNDLKYTMDRELLYRIINKYQIFTTKQIYSAFRIHKNSKSIAEILPFYREFGSLYRSYRSGDKEKDKMRENMAKYFISRGYLKYSKMTENRVKSFTALVLALFYQKKIIMTFDYYSRLLKIIGVKTVKKMSKGV